MFQKCLSFLTFWYHCGRLASSPLTYVDDEKQAELILLAGFHLTKVWHARLCTTPDSIPWTSPNVHLQYRDRAENYQIMSTSWRPLLASFRQNLIVTSQRITSIHSPSWNSIKTQFAYVLGTTFQHGHTIRTDTPLIELTWIQQKSILNLCLISVSRVSSPVHKPYIFSSRVHMLMFFPFLNSLQHNTTLLLPHLVASTPSACSIHRQRQ